MQGIFPEKVQQIYVAPFWFARHGGRLQYCPARCHLTRIESYTVSCVWLFIHGSALASVLADINITKMPVVKEICRAIEEWAPADLAEPWDNAGLQLGDPDSVVSRVVVCLDITSKLLAFVKAKNAQMVISHHPLLFHPIKSFDLSRVVPRLLAGFLNQGTAIFSAHTNLDSARGGVSDILARDMGLINVIPLVPSANLEDCTGLGRVGDLPGPRRLDEIFKLLVDSLDITALSFVGDPSFIVKRIALCGGAGSDLWKAALEKGADLYISGEIKHSTAIEAMELGKAIIDAGHFFTERPVVKAIAEYLVEFAQKNYWDLDIAIFTEEVSPLTFWKI